MKSKLIVSMSLAALIVGASTVQASTNMHPAMNNSKHRDSFIKKELDFQKNDFKAISSDINKGLSNTIYAIRSLQHKKNNVAAHNLSEATKYFNKALKADPNLKLVPIDREMLVFQYKGSAKSIKNAIKIAKGMLKDNNLQLCRDMLAPLKDEIDVTTHYVPMDVYPSATKIAAKLLKNGKSKEALRELRLGLSTIIENQVVIPIPLLASQDFVAAASRVDKTKKKEALSFLNEAKVELQKAILLGYTSNHASDYKALNTKIDNIKKEINGKNRSDKVKKLYNDLKNHFKKLIGKTRKDKKGYNPNVVWNGDTVTYKSAVREENKDINRFLEDQRLDAFEPINLN